MILLDTDSIAQRTDIFRLDTTRAYGAGWICYLWNTSNATLIDETTPEPWAPGCWKWDHVTSAWTMVTVPDEYMRMLSDDIDALRDTHIAAGMPYTFPDGKGTIQLRHEKDLTNVIGVSTAGLMLITAGDTTTKLSFRDQEDVTHVLTGAEAQTMGQAVMTWVSAHYAAAWKHKDTLGTLVEARDTAGLQGYDIHQGWPTV